MSFSPFKSFSISKISLSHPVSHANSYGLCIKIKQIFVHISYAEVSLILMHIPYLNTCLTLNHHLHNFHSPLRKGRSRISEEKRLSVCIVDGFSCRLYVNDILLAANE